MLSSLGIINRPVFAEDSTVTSFRGEINFNLSEPSFVEEYKPENPQISTNTDPASHPSFDSEFLDRQLAKYLKFTALSGPPDILIVGSSRGVQGIDPAVLQQALAARGNSNLKIFNFGINGATAQVVEILLRQILTPEQLPRMIIWADGVRAFNSGRVDRTYNAIIASEGYKRLSNSTRPTPNKPPNTPPASRPNTPSSPNTPPPFHQKPILPGGLNSDPINFLPHTPLVGAKLSQHISEITSFTDKTSQKIAQNQTNPTKNPALNGFNAISTRFNPNTYYQRFPRVAGQYDGDYANFSLEGEQTTALQFIVSFTKSRRIPLLVVNLPLTRDYLDPVRLKFEKQYVQFMWKTAGQEGFMFRDLSSRWLTEYNYFADPSHLNRFGAEVVSQQLAQDKTIPWPVKSR